MVRCSIDALRGAAGDADACGGKTGGERGGDVATRPRRTPRPDDRDPVNSGRQGAPVNEHDRRWVGQIEQSRVVLLVPRERSARPAGSDPFEQMRTVGGNRDGAVGGPGDAAGSNYL